MSNPKAALTKQPYEKPKVLFAERIETHAIECVKSDATSCAEGPVQS